MYKSTDWFKGNLQQTIDLLIELQYNKVFLILFPIQPIHWIKDRLISHQTNNNQQGLWTLIKEESTEVRGYPQLVHREIVDSSRPLIKPYTSCSRLVTTAETKGLELVPQFRTVGWCFQPTKTPNHFRIIISNPGRGYKKIDKACDKVLDEIWTWEIAHLYTYQLYHAGLGGI